MVHYYSFTSYKVATHRRTRPGKILSPLLCTVPLQYVPKIRFTQATIDRLTTNKTKNALRNETVILNYNGADTNEHILEK